MESSYSFIVDVGVGKAIENWLFNENYKVISIRDLNPEMQDEVIIELAVKEDAIIITMDKDFGELIYKENKTHKGILLLRLEDAVAEEKLAVLQNIFPIRLNNIKNNFAVFQNGILRIRQAK